MSSPTPNTAIVHFSPESPFAETEAPTSASSLPASTLSSHSFSVQGGTLKRNVHGKSEVWEFFQVYDEKKFKTHAFCLLCESDVNYGSSQSTSNLEKHIKSHHNIEYERIMSDRANKRPVPSSVVIVIMSVERQEIIKNE
jgi:hypothetical protein